MTSLILASLIFLAIHFLVSGTGLRGGIVLLIGEVGYRVIHSIVALGSLIWLCVAYYSLDNRGMVLWDIPENIRLATYPVIIVAFIFIIGGVTPNRPASDVEADNSSGAENLDPVGGFLRITRHPLMWGIGLWAIAHLINNGDVASQVFFGTFFLLTMAGSRQMDSKKLRSGEQGTEALFAATSWLPFAAIAAGRNRLALGEIGWWRPVLGLVLTMALYRFHSDLFGVALY